VLLLRNQDQEYNNPVASFATCLCKQRSEHERTTLSLSSFSPDGTRVHLSGPAYTIICGPVRPEVRLPLDQRIL